MVWLADYEAWGNTARVIYTPVKINQIQVSQNELQPIRFQGQHFDEETGLHYNRFRYYDPDMGMFTTRDPIGLMGGDNVFAYAHNPTGFIDPLGLAAGATTSGLGKAATTVLKVGRGILGVVWQAITPTTMGDATQPIDSEALERVRAKAKDSPCTSGKCKNKCDELEKKVRDAKDNIGDKYRGGGSVCQSTMSFSQLKQRSKDWLRLAQARAQRDKVCFGGGDMNHQIEQSTAWKQVSKCQKYMKQSF